MAENKNGSLEICFKTYKTQAMELMEESRYTWEVAMKKVMKK